MEKSGNPLITRLSKLPSKRPSESTAEIFSDDSLPAVEILQRYKPKLEVSSEYLFYDGVNNNFTPHPSGGNKRKRGSNSKSAPPRPANSFLCARSLIQPMLRQLSITNGRVSLIMSDLWKNYNNSIFKRYFSYISFLDSCWHRVKYPNYKYAPRRKRKKQHNQTSTLATSAMMSTFSVNTQVSPKEESIPPPCSIPGWTPPWKLERTIVLDQDNNALSDSPQEQACLLPPTDLDSSVFNHHELGEHRDDDSLSSILFNWEDLDMNQWTDELLPESLLNFDQYDFCDLYCGFVNEGPGPFGSSTV